MSFVSELRRRNVIRIATAYIAAAWLIVQVINTVFPAFGFSGDVFRIVIVVLIVGFVPAVVLAWAFQLTPDGLKREHDADRDEPSATSHVAKRLNRIIMAVLAVGIGYFAFDRFVLQPARDTALVEATTQQARNDALAEAYSEKSIVVLPLRATQPLSSANAVYTVAAVDELRNLLISVPGLRVAAETSSDLVAERQLGALEVGELLSVSYVLSGTVAESDDALAIDAELVSTVDGKPVWSHRYDLSVDTLHGTSRSIVEAVLPEIGLPTAQAGRIMSVQPNVASAAYKAFLRGSYFIKQHSVDGYAKATESLSEAVALEPAYSLAWAHLARAHVGTASLAADADVRTASWRLGRAAAERALVLQPDLADVWAVLAAGKLSFELDFAGADAAVKRALQTNPNLEYANRIAGVSAAAFGRANEALEYSAKAVEVDPLSVKALLNAADHAYLAGDFERALDFGQQAIEIGPSTGVVRYVMARAHAGRGDVSKALELIGEEPIEVFVDVGRALIYAESGNAAATEAALRTVIERYSDVAAFNIAEVYGFLEDRDQAFAWLQKAIDTQDQGLMEARLLPGFETLHADPRWEPFLKKAGLPDP